jgi:AmmeMemoRadiSam system protein B
MKLSPLKIISILAVLFVLQIGLFYLVFKNYHNNSATPEKTNSIQLRTFYEGTSFYDSLYTAGQNQIPSYEKEIKAGIIPHHLIVGDKIAAFFSALEKEEYDTVILLSPDHFGLTSSRIMIANADWRTPYGLLKNDMELSSAIVERTNFIYLTDSRLMREHGVNYELPFIKKSLSRAKLTAVLIKKEASRADLDKLVTAIVENSKGKKVLVLASADFSHELIASEADKEDVISNRIIGDFDLDEYKDIKADCPAVVYAVMKYAESIGAKKSRLLWSTNSGRIIGKPNDPTVSHNFYWFSE